MMHGENDSQADTGRLTGGSGGHDARGRSTPPERDDRRRSHEHESRGGLADGPEAALRAYYGNLRVGRTRPR